MKGSIKIAVASFLALSGLVNYDAPVVVTINSPTSYEPTKGGTRRLPKQLWFALNHERSFWRFTSTSAIPQVIRRAYALLSGRTAFSMAEPGSPWNSTDVGIEGLSDRRLRWGVASGHLWIICFEYGGIGSGDAVMAFKVDGHAVDVVWHASFPHPVESVSQVCEMIRKEEADD